MSAAALQLAAALSVAIFAGIVTGFLTYIGLALVEPATSKRSDDQ